MSEIKLKSDPDVVALSYAKILKEQEKEIRTVKSRTIQRLLSRRQKLLVELRLVSSSLADKGFVYADRRGRRNGLSTLIFAVLEEGAATTAQVENRINDRWPKCEVKNSSIASCMLQSYKIGRLTRHGAQPNIKYKLIPSLVKDGWYA